MSWIFQVGKLVEVEEMTVGKVCSESRCRLRVTFVAYLGKTDSS